MFPVSRQSDVVTAICFGHGPIPIPVVGHIAGGAPARLAAGFIMARLGDPVTFNCGHVGHIATGSVKLICVGFPVGRQGDVVVGPMIGHITTGDPTFNSV